MREELAAGQQELSGFILTPVSQRRMSRARSNPVVCFQRQGCIHGEELPYLFGAPLVGGFMHFVRNYTKSEVLLAETTMIYWSNFARTGWAQLQLRLTYVFQTAKLLLMAAGKKSPFSLPIRIHQLIKEANFVIFVHSKQSRSLLGR